MDINGWLTVITIFTAIAALLPREDLLLRFQKTGCIEISCLLAINLLLVPMLIFFQKKIYCSFGYNAQDVAFILVYVSFLWLLFRLFIKPATNRFNTKILAYYNDLLNEKPFDDFFKLFTKYTSVQHINNHWQ